MQKHRSPLESSPRIAPASSLSTALAGVLLASLAWSCAADKLEARADVRHPSMVAAKRLSIDLIYDPVQKIEFSGKPPSAFAWLDDDHFLATETDPVTKKTARWKYDANTGAKALAEDYDALARALTSVGVDEKEAERLVRKTPASITKDRDARLYEIHGDIYRIAGGNATRVTSTPDDEEEATFSPDGKRIAFVRKNDLYVLDLDTLAERRITTDGGELVLNGKLDWLYQEEVYGRGNYRGYWWSPDSRSLALLRLDEAGVPLYTLVDDVKEPIVVETSPYPRAGEPNPAVRLGVADAASGAVQWLELEKQYGKEFLIVDVAWSDKNALHFQVQDREQTWLELDRAFFAEAPRVSVLLRETTPAWTSMNGSPRWLADESFLWFSEHSGFQHIYRYKADGTLLKQLTVGKWEAQTIHGVDEKNGWVYFSGTERSAIGSDVYRVKLDGRELTRLSEAPGTHAATFNPSFTRYVDAWSDVNTPQQVRLHAADGKELRVVAHNDVAALADVSWSRPEFLQVKTRDGFAMEAMLIKPVGFDPSRRYPVFQHTYGGPHAPQVKNAWLGGNGMFFQLLAQEGVAVWVCDNRSASGKGAESAWTAYKRLGEAELADVEDGLAFLKTQPWVDGERIGISGWSYGGFMTSYALTHSQSFAMGIAGGSVTDWANYDSIYTERIMMTPAHNPDGYARASALTAAKNMSGKLYLMHGAIDDNVHPQNTMRFAHELEQAGRDFDLMLYPRSRHGITDPLLVKHMRAEMLDFIRETLLAVDA